MKSGCYKDSKLKVILTSKIKLPVCRTCIGLVYIDHSYRLKMVKHYSKFREGVFSYLFIFFMNFMKSWLCAYFRSGDTGLSDRKT